MKKEAAKAKGPRGSKPTTGRDATRYKFGNNIFSKRRVVHAVIAQYLEKNPKATQAELDEHFRGMTKPASQANEIRYFTGKEDLVQVGGKRVAVYNQITQSILDKVIASAKALGLGVIKPA